MGSSVIINSAFRCCSCRSSVSYHSILKRFNSRFVMMMDTTTTISPGQQRISPNNYYEKQFQSVPIILTTTKRNRFFSSCKDNNGNDDGSSISSSASSSASSSNVDDVDVDNDNHLEEKNEITQNPSTTTTTIDLTNQLQELFTDYKVLAIPDDELESAVSNFVRTTVLLGLSKGEISDLGLSKKEKKKAIESYFQLKEQMNIVQQMQREEYKMKRIFINHEVYLLPKEISKVIIMKYNDHTDNTHNSDSSSSTSNSLRKYLFTKK